MQYEESFMLLLEIQCILYMNIFEIVMYVGACVIYWYILENIFLCHTVFHVFKYILFKFEVILNSITVV